MNKKLHVHFMGICGSGAAPIAIIAKNMGYHVTGCDLNISSYYSNILLENNIKIYEGHDATHINNIDLLVISPAIFDISPDHPEVLEAQKRGILITWQEFSAKYIQREKFVLSVAGTHGKSTTTILLGLTLETANLDPSVEAGTTYNDWGGGYRIGKSKYFVCEADEFNNNFLNYSSSIAIINNVEMDHPEFFKNIDEVKSSFKSFIKNLVYPKILVVNEESLALREILLELKDWLIEENIKVIGYYINNHFDFPFYKEYKGNINNCPTNHSTFKVESDDLEYDMELGLIGNHNIANSLGVLAAALELNIPIAVIRNTFRNFKGIGRRFELIGEVNKIKIFDDFAHHPTAVASTLDSIKDNFNDKRIIAIFEPHQLSRIKLFYNEFADALRKADKVIVTKPFLGREIKKKLDPINFEDFAAQIGSEKATYIEHTEDICKYVLSNGAPEDIIVVFGAGNSYKISREILSVLNIIQK
ncbi:MAG: UDP-N-acetylmuramate--L-alanine ligase [Clostridium sp.]|nr:UDP-N-acetylmuramate--L-alanine ligase [Clostridium sp.]